MKMRSTVKPVRNNSEPIYQTNKLLRANILLLVSVSVSQPVNNNKLQHRNAKEMFETLQKQRLHYIVCPEMKRIKKKKKKFY